ncbi:MAG: gliding motility-associated C-terminal domain-containing protein, partial [Catalinimonas sp.]
RVRETNAAGCPGPWRELLVEVVELRLPTVFSPNGDGRNDVLSIALLEQFETTKLEVYNRWGRHVCTRAPYDGTWDGDNLPAGTYFYLLQAGGQTFRRWVQIMR